MLPVPRSALLSGLALFLGLFLLPGASAPAQAQGIEVESVTAADGGTELSVPVGGSLTVTVRGRNLHLIEDATVLLGRAAARGVGAELAPVRRGDRTAQTARQVRIRAEAGARPADGYRLRVVAGRGSADVATFAVTPADPPRRAAPAPRPDRADRAAPTPAPPPAARETRPAPEARSIRIASVTAADGSDALTVPAGGRLVLHIHGENLDLLEGAAVVLGRAAARDVMAQLAAARPGDRGASAVRRVVVRAGDAATPSDGYRLRVVASGQQADVAALEVTPAPAVARRTDPPPPEPAAPAREERAAPDAEEPADPPPPPARREDPRPDADEPPDTEDPPDAWEEEADEADTAEFTEVGYQPQAIYHPDDVLVLLGFTVEIDGQVGPETPWQTASGGSDGIEIAASSTGGDQYHTTTLGHKFIEELVLGGPLAGGDLLSNDFTVEIDGVALPSGRVLSVEIDDLVIDAQELTTGADWDYRVYAPGDAHLGKLTLRTRVDPQGELYDWWRDHSQGQNIRKTISVTVRKRDGSEARRYSFFETFPERWRGFVLDKLPQIAAEELTVRIGGHLSIQDNLGNQGSLLMDWIKETFEGQPIQSRTLTVREILKDGESGRAFVYHDAFPVRYVFPRFSVYEEEPLYEEITIKANRLDGPYDD